MFFSLIALVATAFGQDEEVTAEELGVREDILVAVVANPIGSAKAIAALDSQLDEAARRVATSEARTAAEKERREKAEAEIEALREELSVAKALNREKADEPASTVDTRGIEARIDALDHRMASLGVPDKIPVATAAVDRTVEARPTAAVVMPTNPCLGQGWIVGSLDDPNAYTPSGPVRCHSDKNPKSLKFRNESQDFGYVLVVNGMVVVPQIHGQTVVSPASGIPRELAAAVMPGGMTGLPIIPPGSTLYSAVPALTGTWRLYRFVRDPIAGTYELDEACKPREYSRSGYSVDWEEAIGDGMGYCD